MLTALAEEVLLADDPVSAPARNVEHNALRQLLRKGNGTDY